MENENSGNALNGIIGFIIILGIIWFIFSDSSRALDGCDKDPDGWTNSTSVLGKSPSEGGCSFIPCVPVTSSRATGYCSKSHALEDM